MELFGKKLNEEKVVEVLQKAYAMEFIVKLEYGIHTVLSESRDNLSGGQG